MAQNRRRQLVGLNQLIDHQREDDGCHADTQNRHESRSVVLTASGCFLVGKSVARSSPVGRARVRERQNSPYVVPLPRSSAAGKRNRTILPPSCTRPGAPCLPAPIPDGPLMCGRIPPLSDRVGHRGRDQRLHLACTHWAGWRFHLDGKFRRICCGYRRKQNAPVNIRCASSQARSLRRSPCCSSVSDAFWAMA